MAPTKEVAPVETGAAKGKEGEPCRSGGGLRNRFTVLTEDEHDAKHNEGDLSTVAGQQQRQRTNLVALRGCTHNAARFANMWASVKDNAESAAQSTKDEGLG